MNKCCRSFEASLVDFQQFNLEFKCRVWRNDLSEPSITVGLCQIQRSENHVISNKKDGGWWNWQKGK